MASIDASITSTGLISTGDATGILQLKSNGITALTVHANANVSIESGLSVSGSNVQPLVSGTSQASTSGTNFDFTGIPSWAKRITVIFSGVSSNGTSNTALVQIGSGSVTSSGYAGGTCNQGATATYHNATNGFQMGTGGSAANILTGTLFITNVTGNTWVASGTFAYENTNFVGYTAGKIALAGVLDRVRVGTGNGTDGFDAGTINIMYE